VDAFEEAVEKENPIDPPPEGVNAKSLSRLHVPPVFVYPVHFIKAA
jgi:hypothetical protein